MGNRAGKCHCDCVRHLISVAATGACVEQSIDVSFPRSLRKVNTAVVLADLIRLHSVVQGNHHGIAIKLGPLDEAGRDAAEPGIELAKGVVQKELVEQLGGTGAVAGVVAEQLGVLKAAALD